ncbi:hypothetical protein A3D00_00775 [Candidatus Woesebacteria bacterium RIFCSPHIGHO2_02_FULL_38_9]|uniref:Predicted DNA-binding protein ribbon-helix-helix domain-containing protein n=1 Tax=Candidatus Woesebacteria bacterium RIFCSPHIGHO2_01_FULL_39_28 TaxID=1802496 RepID=A0A1F7YB42_9BACT|nr:MAG: hypothetical protein A2627_03475 [Candidatus Woesebacteria bacterium RIFCSPHIGHO2_01_FULL_39_28]OGM32253.1 MAG: hypothetical protein A3D00_00775 [Candidatus Woesebacteria bacterium RIFCSPHIGHO2_02_FULL_38_9]OGM57498.1 MAG: hypothetical protein A3A50_00285 [Candidatus Woesebacteria bacterium RIFCSPLOWO2_01_FULL_38_20]
MIRTQIYIPDDLYKELKILSNITNTNFSSLIREGAKLVVKNRSRTRKKFNPWKDFIGKGLKGKPKDLSEKIDYYLYEEPYEDEKK